MKRTFRKSQTPRSLAVPLACSVVVGAPAVMPALAQDPALAPEAEAERMERVVVTGSNIPTAETIEVVPLDRLNEEVIQRIGSTDVLATLKKMTAATAGNGNTGQEVNNAGTGESYVALRNLRTLVLVNGRRLGNSSFSNGAFVDLNTIPLAAIERIEVLKDGASAIYGSEAVGGVVNIITKQDWTGAEVGGRYGTELRDTKMTEYSAYVVAGTSTDKASFTAGGQYYHRDPLITSDRPTASYSFDQLVARNVAGASYTSPSFPGKVQDATGAYVLRSSPLLRGTSDYDPTVVTPPVLPGQSFRGNTAVADYLAAVQAAGLPAPYVPDPGLWLNTTQFGTHSYQSQERANFFGSGSYDLFEERMVLFADFLYANIESEGALAPSPVIGLGTGFNIFVPANNPYNPFGVDLGPGAVLGPNAGDPTSPSAGARVRTRFVPSDFADGGPNGPYSSAANRLFDAQTDYYHFVGGLKGDFNNNYGYNAAYTYNRYDQVQYTKNAINGVALDLALKPSADPADAALGLSQLQGKDGAYVPVYNIFQAGGQNDPRTMKAIQTTLFQTGVSEQWDATGSVNGTPFSLPAGDFAFAIGGQAGQENLSIDYDGLTRLGKVPGLNPNNPTEGRRDYWAIYGEVLIPLTSPDLDIPAFHKTEVTAAFRHESFDPGGDATVPKVALRWQPVDEQFTLRGNYSQSFIAPTTYQLFGGTAVNVPQLSLPDGNLQEFTGNLSNPNLRAVDAESYGGGIVLSPRFLRNLTVSVDYYHIKTENDIYRMSAQTMVSDLNANGSNSQWVNYYRRNDGARLSSPVPNQVNDATWGFLEVPLLNGAEVETEGIDLTGNYLVSLGSAGELLFYANANILLSYEYADPISGGPFEYEGNYTDASNGVPGGQGTLPDFILNTGVTWDIPVAQDSLAVTINSQLIPEVKDYWGEYFTVDGSPWTVESWYRIDLQVSYELGKHKEAKRWYDGTRFTVGCNNITDNDPPMISTSFEDNTDKTAYDLIGRFFYLEVAKRF